MCDIVAGRFFGDVCPVFQSTTNTKSNASAHRARRSRRTLFRPSSSSWYTVSFLVYPIDSPPERLWGSRRQTNHLFLVVVWHNTVHAIELLQARKHLSLLAEKYKLVVL